MTSFADVLSGAARWCVLEGDCLEVLRAVPDASIDSAVTDPPYGLSFMGKAWDYDVPKAEVWREVLRVLKPGGHLLSFFGTRTYHRGVVQIEDAGFEVRDSLCWLYGSGFPKSLNVGKAIDGAAGAEREAVGLTRGGIKKGSDTLIGSAVPEAHKWHPVTAPATEAAKQWEGWGTALKPAHEPVVLARKPLTGTVAANVQKFGTGALNVDGCRIGDEQTVTRRSPTQTGPGGWKTYGFQAATERLNPPGRWPANVVLDEEAAARLDEMSGELAARGNVSPSRSVDGMHSIAMAGPMTDRSNGPEYNFDRGGGASRFFYTAKADRGERDAGLELLAPVTGGAATDRQDGSAGLNSPRAGAGRTGGARNTHPTVKPVSLMRWLVRLVTPPDGVVLDPFLGSGTTGVAALHEGFRIIGIERDADYVRLARERLAAWAYVHERLTTIEARAAGQIPLFQRAEGGL